MTLKRILKLTAVAAFAATLLIAVGCGNDDDNDAVSTDPSDLYLSAGQAWIDTISVVGRRDGFILGSDGSFRAVTDDESGAWTINDEGTFSATDGSISVTGGWLYYNFQSGMTATFSISGDNLTIVNGEFTDVFKKTPNVNPATITQ